MDFEFFHEKYRIDLLEKIKIAANIGDSDTIRKCSEMFEKLDKIKMLITEILDEFKALANFLNKKAVEPANNLSPEENNEKRESEFIQKIHDIGFYLENEQEENI